MEENKETKVVNFTTDNGEEIPFFVVEETKIAGENYLLVTDSEISEWTSVKKAMKRDVLGELKEAIQDEDLVFCESNHRVEHAFFMGHGCEFESDIKPVSYTHLTLPTTPYV